MAGTHRPLNAIVAQFKNITFELSRSTLTPNGQFYRCGTIAMELKNILSSKIIIFSSIVILTPNEQYFRCGTIAMELKNNTFSSIVVLTLKWTIF